MKKIPSLLITITFLLFTFTTIGQTTWKADLAHSNLGFAILHQLVNDVKGTVKVTESIITQPKEDFTDATMSLKADLNTIDTDNDKRDAHLKTADFFDTAKFPELIFQSTSVIKKTPDHYTINGNLTLHGITKPVTLNAVSKSGTNVMNNKPVTGFKVTGVIKRSDFDISTSTPSAMLNDEVSIEANLEFGKE
ncbi:MAG: YceI family protein [Bacteroidetes bacterium]|nr:YceI family protein [Bacteroidota bacterium]